MMLAGTPSRRDILDSKRVVPDRLQIASDRYFRGLEIAFIILRYQVVHEGQLRRLYGLVEDGIRPSSVSHTGKSRPGLSLALQS